MAETTLQMGRPQADDGARMKRCSIFVVGLVALLVACSPRQPGRSSPVAAEATASAAELRPADAGVIGGPDAAALMARALVFDLPEPGLDGRTALALWATFYYIPRVVHEPSGHALRDMDGGVLGPRLTRRDWCEGAMQGTVTVTMPDGGAPTINYAGVRDNVEVDCRPIYPKHPAIGRTRYTHAEGPWGDGVDGMRLVPFRSLAVDSRTIPYDSLIYIPAARGTTVALPSGESAIHDGYFYAADRGGAIKGTHIDVFVGPGRFCPFELVRNKPEPTFDAYILAGAASAPALAEAAQRLRGAHRP